MKKVIFTIIAATLLVACGSSEGQSPRSQEAREEGRAAALRLVAVDHSDTLAMQEAILDAHATKSKYIILDDTVAQREFDNAFRDALNEKDPSLAREIF